MNNNGYVPFLINTLDIIVRGYKYPISPLPSS